MSVSYLHSLPQGSGIHHRLSDVRVRLEHGLQLRIAVHKGRHYLTDRQAGRKTGRKTGRQAGREGEGECKEGM